MNKDELEKMILEGVNLLEDTFADVACNLSEVLAEQEMTRPHQLLSKKLLLDGFQEQIAEEILLTKEQILNGARLIAHMLLQKDSPVVKDTFSKLLNLAVVIAHSRNQFIDALADGKTPQEIAGISDEAIEVLYQAASSLFKQKHYQEAANAFGFLTILNAQNPVFWIALGHSEYQALHYQQALFAYAYVARIDPDNYACHILSCRCYKELGNIENAINALELALLVLGNKPQHKDLIHILELQQAELKKGIL